MCTPLVDFLHAVRYSSNYADGANFDRTNFQYLLRGLLVHLDDPLPEIQQAVQAVLAQAMHVDAATFIPELLAVKDRHRSPKPCMELIEAAKGIGQVV